MNDSNQTMDSLSGGDSGRRMKKLPILLLVLAVILGLVMWRARHAAPPQPAATPVDTASAAQAPAPAETAKVAAPAVTSSAPETTVTTATPAMSAPDTATIAKPHVAKHKHVKAKPVESGAVVAEKPLVAEKPVVEEPSPAPAPAKTVASKPKVKAEPKPVVKAEAPAPAPIAAEPKSVPTPSIASAQVAKKFVMEDQPMPEKPVLSEESKLAFNAPPKSEEIQSDQVAATPAASDAFKQAMDAYHKQDYANAIKLFGQLPKPTTKQQGNPTRDQFVQGNFLLGVSLLKSDRAAEAAAAFQTVLEYDKYNPVASMNLGICYVELKQYFKANKAFESVTRDQGSIDPADFDDVMQRTKYFWALAWTRMYKTSKDADKQAYYQQQAVMKWKDYQTWFGKNEKYRSENRKAEDYIKSLSAM